MILNKPIDCPKCVSWLEKNTGIPLVWYVNDIVQGAQETGQAWNWDEALRRLLLVYHNTEHPETFLKEDLYGSE